MKKVNILIIGTGPTGLGAAWRLNEVGYKEFIILEKNPHVGGLAFTLKDKYGFLWDFGGHVLFSHYKYFDDVYEKVMKGDYFSHLRESYIVMKKDEWVPYPFQYNTHRLKDKEKIFFIFKTLIKNKFKNIKPKNFKEWILKTFGEGIAKYFLFPYNFKVWAHPLEMMDFQWIGERVAQVDIEKALYSLIFQKDQVSWGPNNKFKFPKYGGNQELWNRIASYFIDKIKFKEQVVQIDFEKKQLKTNKEEYSYEYLISTMPIDVLITFSNAPKKIKEYTKHLYHSRVHVIGVGLKQPMQTHLKNKCWFYFPDNSSPFYRITIFSNYSPNNVPDISKHWSIMTEVSESRFKKVPPIDKLKEKVVDSLIKLGFVKDKKQVHHITHFSKEYAYPTPTTKRDLALHNIQNYLVKKNVYSRGRFGGWKYEVGNQDHSFMQGVEVVDKILKNKQEKTYKY